MLSRKKFTFCIGQAPSQFSSQWSDSIYHITRARKNYANYTQTLHSTLHSADLPRVTKCIVWGANYTQTIHKTIHCNERDKETKDERRKTKDESTAFLKHSGSWIDSIKKSLICFGTRNARNVQKLMGQLMRQFMGINGEIEKPFPLGRGWGRLPLQKSNNFERFFGDSTLTFLTYRNTFLLVILPTRRIIFLCLPLI